MTVPDLRSALTGTLILAAVKAFETATCPIKAFVLTNPNNPLGQCYPQSVLEECLRFCQARKIHFISDEVYALTSFTCPDMPSPAPFVSALSLDLRTVGCDASRVHLLWSTSKDFGQNGFRLASNPQSSPGDEHTENCVGKGCVVTQANRALAAGVVLASNTQTSSLSAICTTALLNSPQLPNLLALNSERLACNYRILTAFFTRRDITYLPCNAALYVFARMAKEAQSWDDELAAVQRLKDVGVLVSPGRGYRVPEIEKGWMRVGFAVTASQLREALRRMEILYSGV